MRFWMARLWHMVWGLPQNLVGLVMMLALRGPRRRSQFRSAVVTEWTLDSGLAMGMFLFVPRGCPRSLVLHEYGHTIQSMLIGPLYLPAVVIPSLVWAGLPACRRFRARRNFSYYRFGPERWANRLTRRVTGEQPMGWYDRR